MNRIFEAPNVPQKLRNFARTSQVAKNYVFQKKKKWAGPNGATAPPTKLRASSPTIRFHQHVRKSVHICIVSGLTKKSLGATSETKQEVSHFD